MLKRILCTMMAGLITLSVAGCTSKSTESADEQTSTKTTMDDKKTEKESSKEKTKVSFYTWWGDSEKDLGAAVVKDFEKANPDIDIVENYIAYNDYLSKLNTLIAAKQTPDVFFIQEFLANEWGSKGIVKDLNPLYESDGLNPDELYLPTAMFKTGENLWAVDFSMTTLCLYYNKKMMADAGVTPPTLSATNPWTWTEFVEAAKKMTKDGSGKTPNDNGFDYEGAQAYGTMMPTSQNNLQALLYTNDIGIASDDGMTLGVSTPAGIEVIQSIADLSMKEKCAPTVATAKGAFTNQAVMLMNGQLGMFIDGTYRYPDFVKEKYDVGVAQIPMFKKANNMAWSAPFMISADTKVEKEAFTFYKSLVDFDKTLDASINNKVSMGNLPHTLNTLNNPEQTKKWSENYNADMATLTNDILTNASRLGECVTLKNFAVIIEQNLIPQLDKVWLGEMDAQTAMGELAPKLAPEMKGTWQ